MMKTLKSKLKKIYDCSHSQRLFRSIAAFLAAVLLTASCYDEFVGTMLFSDDSISFTAEGALTKAPVTAFPTDFTMTLSAYHNAATGTSQAYFSGIPFIRNSEGVWAPATKKYWPQTGSLNFLGYACKDLDMTSVSWGSDPSGSVTVTVGDNSSLQEDLMFTAAASVGKQTSAYTLSFSHAMANLQFTVAAPDGAYNPTDNTGVTVSGIKLVNVYNSGKVTATRSGSTVSYSWSNPANRKDLTAPGISNASVGTSAAALGNGLVVVPQTPVGIQIEYILHNGKDASGNAVNVTRTYTYTPTGSWDAGNKYTITFSFSQGTVSVSSTLSAWTNAEQTWFFATGNATSWVGTDFNFSSTSPMWWRLSGSDSYEPLTYESGTWGSSVRFESTSYYVTVTASSSNYTVAYETKRQPSYLTIKALGNGTLTYQRTSYPIEYSLNDGDWTAYSSAVTLSNGDSIKFRGTNPNFSSAKAFNTTFDFDVYGNPLSIIDKDNFQNITDLTTLNNNGQNCLMNFFSGTNVVDASGLELPAQTLARYCYARMFYNCRKLTKAPVLPALTLVDYCYSYMFNQCTSLMDVRMYAENIVTTRALDYWLQNPNYSYARLPENVHFVFNIKCPTDFATLSNSYSLNKTLSWYCDEDISNISTTASFEMYNYYDEKSITSSTVPVIASLATSGDRNISDKMSYQLVDNEICSYSNGILKSLLATGTVEHGLRGTITINDILYSVDVPLTINSRTPTSTSFYAKFVSGTYGFPVSSYGYTYQEFVLRDGKNMFVSGLENLELSMRMTFSVGKTPIYAGSAEGVTYSLSTDAYLSINGDNAEYVSSGGPTEITASLGGVTASNTKTVYTKRCTRWVIGDIDSFEPHNPNWSSSRPHKEYVWGYRQTGERETDFSGTISSSYVVIDGSYIDTDLHWWGRYKYGSGNFPDSYESFEGNSSVNISSSGTSFSISMRTYYTVQFYWQGYYSTFFSEADYQSRYWLCEDHNGQTIQND